MTLPNTSLVERDKQEALELGYANLMVAVQTVLEATDLKAAQQVCRVAIGQAKGLQDGLQNRPNV